MHGDREKVRALLWFLMCHGKHTQLRFDTSFAHTTADLVELISRPCIRNRPLTHILTPLLKEIMREALVYLTAPIKR